MSEGSGRADEPDVRESVESFRRVGAAVGDGFRKLCGWGRAWFDRRHLSFKFAISLAVWFGGNWTYNRIAPTVIDVLAKLPRQVSSKLGGVLAFRLFENKPVFVAVQIVLILLVMVVVQNRAQTQKLKEIESKMTTMTDSTTKSTDGGTRDLPPTGPRAIGGAIIGAIVGVWFGPGGVLAGMFLGFTIGDSRDIRAYERSQHSSISKAESRTEH